MCVQAIVAPFALENLGCTGLEERLLDCPVAERSDYRSEFNIASDPDYYTLDSCDPFTGSYVQVACGNSSAGGTHPLDNYHIILNCQ